MTRPARQEESRSEEERERGAAGERVRRRREGREGEVEERGRQSRRARRGGAGEEGREDMQLRVARLRILIWGFGVSRGLELQSLWIIPDAAVS